eukprot:1148645-Pelagomonas_calceolata.AAC.7
MGLRERSRWPASSFQKVEQCNCTAFAADRQCRGAMEDLRSRLAKLGVEVQQQQQQFNETYGLSPASPRAYRVS